MLNILPELNQIKTSETFSYELEKKIHNINNKGLSLWDRMFSFETLGFNYSTLLGFSIALVIIFSSSYILINQDYLPSINFDKISSNPKSIDPSLRGTVNNPQSNQPTIADSDTSAKIDKYKKHENQIKLVRGK